MRGFLRELKQRRVYRVALAYGVVASGLVQIGGTILPIFGAPPWVQQVFVVLVAAGFPFALVLAWAFDITQFWHSTDAECERACASRSASDLGACRGRDGDRRACPRRLLVLASLAQSQPNEPPVSRRKASQFCPFENLSTEKENAFFADGVQDQILTDLSKVADLKVIGHTSVQQYKEDHTRDRQKIGEQLGVAYLLEGSVQRSERRLRIIAHLIDARTNAQLWAETYDRELADVFAIQSEIAQTIVAQLQATSLPQEKALIEQRPTIDLVAYRPLPASEGIDRQLPRRVRPEGLRSSRRFVCSTKRSHAIRVCPGLRYAARAHDLLYFLDLDPTAARIVRGQVAAEMALRLDPNSAEAHLAMADYYFRCLRDYDRAEKELALARPGIPNSIAFLTLAGYLHRREGNWEEGKHDFARAVELDPRNINASNLLADTYVLLRQFDKAIAVADHSIAVGLDLPITQTAPRI